MSTYSSTQQTGNNANSEALFQKHSQTIATSIQKILQNGKTNRNFLFQCTTFNINLVSNYSDDSFDNESHGKSNWHGSGNKWFETATVMSIDLLHLNGKCQWISFLLFSFMFSHQIRTYTQQLVKDTDGILKDLVNNNNDRHLKIQRERLVDEFTTALTSFQVRCIFFWVGREI